MKLFSLERKTNARGFVGSNKTIIMDFLELDLVTRKATSACVLLPLRRGNRQLKWKIETCVISRTKLQPL